MTGLVALMLLAAIAPNQEAQTGTKVSGKQTASPVQRYGRAPIDWQFEKAVPLAEARKTFQRFAQCVAKKRPAQAEIVVLRDVSNSEIIRKYSILRDSKCLMEAERDKPVRGARLAMPGDFLRYALAEALIARQQVQPPANLEAVPPLSQRTHDPAAFVPRAGAKLSNEQRQYYVQAAMADRIEIFASQFGECVVRADPGHSQRLFATEPSSKDEAVVLATLKPAMRGCLPAGEQVRINMAMARGTIALNYYRLAKASAGAMVAEKPQ